MANISEMQTQTIAKFKQPKFAVNFAVDNNPIGVIEKITSMGYGDLFTGDLNSDKLIAKDLILHWYEAKQTREIMDVLNSVNYINEGKESLPYTQGFIDYFRQDTASQGVDESVYRNVDADGMKFSWDGLLTALGAGLTTYGSFAGGAGSNGEPTQAQIEAEQAEKKKKMWTTIAWIIGIIILLAMIIIAYKYFTKKQS